MEITKYIPLTRKELFIGTISFLGCLIFISGSRLSRLSDTASIQSERPVHIYLSQRTNLEEVSQIFADSAVVDSRKELLWAGRLLGWNNFLPGHYLIDGNYSYDVFLSRMARGIQDPVELTILPGLRETQLIADIADNFRFDSSAVADVVSDSSFLAPYGMTRKDWIGRMLPETYSLYWTSKPEGVVKRIFNEFDKQVTEAHADRIEQLDRTLNEIVTLASIIEWEVRFAEEKPMVSGLYWNRLRRGMRLQADPTVNYALGERRRLLYEDLETDHPYNTYLYRGLPPGPITNPDIASLNAALFPENHDYLYMVANPDNGYHQFSETFEEHREKSEKWREWLREQYRIKRERERSQSTSPDTR